MRAIDFFCGIGGLTRGLLNVGIKVVAGFDVNGACKETYERNNKPAKFHQQDISNVTAKDIWKILGTRRTNDLLLVGCAPCQPFTNQRKSKPVAERDGSFDFERDAKILGAFGRLIEETTPGQILIENVPGLTRVRGFSTYRRFLRLLADLNYSVAEGVLDAKQYGVPQTRRRFVLIGMKGRQATLPQPECGPGLKDYSTVRDSISHYPPIAAGERNQLVPNHIAAAISEINLERLRATPHDGGDRRAWPRDLRLQCHRGKYKGHTDVYGRLAWDEPAPTLTGRCNSISNGRYGHPCQDRAISLREAASLQTFGDAYVFCGTSVHISRVIGNAVPVKFAESLGRHLLALRYGEEGASPTLNDGYSYNGTAHSLHGLHT
jgi:DNA (cytosine-5)-methyltransferase 1